MAKRVYLSPSDQRRNTYAVGGTTEAIISLIEQLGGEVVKLCFVMELAGLKGRERLAGYKVESAIIYEGK